MIIFLLCYICFFMEKLIFKRFLLIYFLSKGGRINKIVMLIVGLEFFLGRKLFLFRKIF